VNLSEATLAWEAWRTRRRRRRNLLSWAGSVALAAAVLALVAWGGFLPLHEIGEKGESLTVKLGIPEGEDLPMKVSARPDPAMQAILAAQREAALTSTVETRPSEPEPAPATNPASGAIPVSPKSQPKPAAPAAKTTPTPVAPVPSAAPVAKSDQPVVTEKVIRGSEKGNSSELILKPQGEKISQNAYWPVYLFMPLPPKLDPGILGRVGPSKQLSGDGTPIYSAEERRTLLLQAYSKTADGLTLTSDREIGARPGIWLILEDAGYDVANADYKKGKPLQPVVLTFKLGIPKGPSDNPELTDVHLDQSSGNGAVDEAVLYAFQKSTFANGTGQVAQGRYTYDFTGKR
jgi:hypothetical protein